MRIRYLNDQGIHVREIEGVETLKDRLPSDWYAFASLELMDPGKTAREVDVAIVMDDRIVLVDLKDWNGRIVSDGTRWFKNGNDEGASPVKKIRLNAKVMGTLLARQVNVPGKARPWVPFVGGCVVLTGNHQLGALPQDEIQSVFSLDEFCRILTNKGEREKRLGSPPGWIEHGALLEKGGRWRTTLTSFFCGGAHFRPQEIKYAENRVASAATHRHPSGLYEEFDTEETNPSKASGLLRRWNFSVAAARYHSSEGRQDVAGREREVLGFLETASDHLAVAMLRHKAADPDLGMRYWEVFERRRELKRLRDFVTSEADSLTSASRLDLARSLLSHLAAMHALGASHADLGPHSIWLALPSTVRISHFLASQYPATRTLGDRRYELLANGAILPEDKLGLEQIQQRRDVFLLGLAVHLLLFSIAAELDDDLAKWNPAVDEGASFAALHGWFARVLEWDPDQRFPSAVEALAEFNRATSPRNGDAAALERLERFRRWPDLFEVAEDYPRSKRMASSSRALSYRSNTPHGSFLVKCWRSTNWDDVVKDAPRLAQFCERALELGRCRVGGFAKPREIAFLQEGIVLVQDFVEGPTLAQAMSETCPDLMDPNHAAALLARLCDTLERLHEEGFTHGDLSPGNVLLTGIGTEDGPCPVLVDLCDLGHEDDGELVTAAYAPKWPANAAERDRFAALRIAEELLTVSGVPAEAGAELERAIRTCREREPRLATLRPLSEALASFLLPPSVSDTPELIVSAPGLNTTRMVSDDGIYHVFAPAWPRTRLQIVGAAEELVLDFHETGEVRTAWSRALTQSEVGKRQRGREMTASVLVELRHAQVLSVTGLEPLVQAPELEAWRSSLRMRSGVRGAPGPEETSSDEGGPEDVEAGESDAASEPELVLGEDLEGGQGAGPPGLAGEGNVRALWRALMDAESERHTEVKADADSHYSAAKRRHAVPYMLTSGALDYDREEQVLVRKLTRSGAWYAIGTLDHDLTTRDALWLAPEPRGDQSGAPLCRAGDTLRLESHWEVNSRNVRHKALRAILDDRAGVEGLVRYLSADAIQDAEGADASGCLAADDAKAKALSSRYGLNPSQAEAMVRMLSAPPLGLLQGPPGTGKTTFIAALVHHATESGRVRNVLISSQSHEALNNVAEEIVRLYREEGVDPNLVRIGQEGMVSIQLKPFHSHRIEERHREQFRARLAEKFALAGRRIGAPPAFVEQVAQLELSARPIVTRLATPDDLDEADEERGDRMRERADLLAALARQLDALDLPMPSLDDDPEAVFQDIVEGLVGLHPGATAEHARRLSDVAELSRDWLNSVSSRTRNFESFLVATRQIVCGTCVGLGRTSLAIPPGGFDLVVVDEAARCTAGELAVPLVAARWAILVGDQRQLQPHYDKDLLATVSRRLSIARSDILCSDFERALRSPHALTASAILNKQYRMLPPIGRLVSDCFYEGRLEHGRLDPDMPADATPPALPKELTWIDTSAKGAVARQSRVGTSLENEAEAAAIADFLRECDEHRPFRTWLAGRADGSQPIGIICMYAAQRDRVRRKLAGTALSQPLRNALKIETVDSYQGKQNDLVIVSLVRNNEAGPLQDDRATIQQGYMERPNRINVALSRARDRLVVVGSLERWPDGGPLAKVAEYVRRLASEGEADVRQA